MFWDFENYPMSNEGTAIRIGAFDRRRQVLTQAQLLANNPRHTRAGRVAGLQLTCLSHASHLASLSFSGTGNVNFLLEPNFYGTAGFDYAVAAQHPDSNTIKSIASYAYSMRAGGQYDHENRVAANDFKWRLAA
jgi:hypothetical protein